MSDTTTAKRRVLVIGSGGVGTMVSVALERSGQASVTSVLRSNYEQVVKHGFEIESIDHGKLSAWRPSASMYPRKVARREIACPVQSKLTHR